MSITKYGKCNWDGIGAIKWMRRTFVYEMNDIKMTR